MSFAKTILTEKESFEEKLGYSFDDLKQIRPGPIYMDRGIRSDNPCKKIKG